MDRIKLNIHFSNTMTITPESLVYLGSFFDRVADSIAQNLPKAIEQHEIRYTDRTIDDMVQKHKESMLLSDLAALLRYQQYLQEYLSHKKNISRFLGPPYDAPDGLASMRRYREAQTDMFCDVFRGNIPSRALGFGERARIAEVRRRAKSFIEPWRDEGHPALLEDSYRTISISHRSPVQMAVELIGAAGAFLGLVFVTLRIAGWMSREHLRYREHEVAVETKEYLLKKLKEMDREPSDALLEKLVEGVNDDLVDISSITGITGGSKK